MLSFLCFADTRVVDRNANGDFLKIQDAGFAPDINLTAYWKLNGDAADSSGNGFDGIVHGNPAWVSEGRDSVSILLDGLDDYVEIPGYTGISGGASRTCSAWIKTTAAESGQIVSWGSSADGQKWTFRTESDGALGVGIWNGYIKTTTRFVNDGNWHHVAAVLSDDGSPDVSEVQLYIDGVLETSPFISNSRVIATTDAQNVVIGALLDVDGVSYTSHFEGFIDDVRIFDVALNAEEIVAIMGPVLDVSSNTFLFTVYEPGSNPDAQRLTIENPSGETQDWSMDLTDKPNWLTVTPTAGSLGSLKSETVVISVDIAGLLDGHYSYRFQVDAGDDFCGLRTITVNLRFIDLWVPADYSTIQAAIDAATAGDVIGVSPGTYVENITLKNGVALIGAGVDTIIKGNSTYMLDRNGSTVSSFECDSSTLLEGFVITNGVGYVQNISGGMYNYRSSPTVKNCIFSGNTAYSGGGMYNLFSSPTITNCTFSNNTASSYGGGMFNVGSGPTISHCTFSGNTASRGGGMYHAERTYSITITYCTFDGNRAYYAGGGIYSDVGDLTVSNCKFVDNAAEGKPFPSYDPPMIGKGGALYLFSGGSCEMVNCTLTGNRACETGGGLWLQNYGQVTLTNCILWDNSATLSKSGNEITNNGEQGTRSTYLPVIRYCDIAGCGGSGTGWNASMGIDGGGNIDADPLFEGADGAIQLDGLDDYVEIPGYTGISGGASRTCSAWIKTTAAESGQIVSWGSSADGQKWTFRTESDGALGVGIWNGYIKTTTRFVNDGNWHHVAAVLADDGSPDVSEIQLYIDGVLETNPFISKSRAIATTDDQNVVIGALLDADGVNYASHFSGQIGDVRIYNRALSPFEIQQVMNDDLPPTDLEAHWKLDGNADDSSGNDRHGILYGGPAWATERSVDGAIQLDGLDDYVEIPGYTGISGGASRTCSAWIKTTAAESGQIVSWGSSADGQKWTFRTESDGALGVGIWNGYIKTTTRFVNDGNWHHVAAVLADDGSPDVSEIQLYIDGVLETNPFISKSRAIATTDDQNVVIGALLAIDGVSYMGHFEGLIDDVRVYSRALSPFEIQQVMNDDLPPTDLEAHWKLDGNADDSSGNDRHGILYGGPVWATEDPVDVLYLDGLDDYVEIPGYTGISGGASRTCSAWIKTTAAESGQIVSWGSSADGQKWTFRTESDGALGVGIWNGYIKTTTQFVNDGNWHHVAAVLSDDGSPDVSEIQLYIDGVLETNPFISNSRAIATTDDQNVVIGALLAIDGVSYTSHFEGRLCDVRVYSRALSPFEIQQVMNDDLLPTDLEAHWKLDGHANDVSGNDRHGILYRGPVWTRERFTGVPVDVLCLDGLDDYVEIPGYTGISGGVSRTCSAWIKPTATEPGIIVSWGSSETGQKWVFRTESDGSLGVGVWGGYIKTKNYGDDIWQFVNDGNWHHVAAVLSDDGSPDVSEIQLYIDGVLETSPFISNSRAIATTDDQNVVIGALLAIDGVSYTSHFEGRLRDVRVYSRALSPFEIQQVMDNENAPTTDLEAHWKLDGHANDVSGNNRNGILFGEPAWAIDRFVDGEDNLRLKPCSPCINAGNKNVLQGGILTDLDSNPRVIDGQVDMGCYEYLTPIEVEAKLTPQVLNRKSTQPHVIGWLELTGFSADEIDPDEPMVLMPGDIAAGRVEILPGKNGATSITLVGFFDYAALVDAIVWDTPPWQGERYIDSEAGIFGHTGEDLNVTVAAKLLTGQWVYGRDVVTVK
jgi:parallel beta-helix repeat protein